MKTLVTGVAGFIGYHVATYLLARGDQVIGIDNINDYYDTSLKEARLQQLEAMPQAGNFKFLKLDIALDDELATFFETERLMPLFTWRHKPVFGILLKTRTRIFKRTFVVS